MWQILLNYHQRMGILPLKKRVNHNKCSFATKQRMFEVFAIEEPGSPVPALYATLAGGNCLSQVLLGYVFMLVFLVLCLDFWTFSDPRKGYQGAIASCWCNCNMIPALRRRLIFVIIFSTIYLYRSQRA